MNYQTGRMICEGTRKMVYAVVDEPHLVLVDFRDNLFGSGGDRPGMFAGKGTLSNTIACNVFRLLQENSLPVAFVRQGVGASFIADRCTILPLTVVVRSEADGLYLKRHPNLEERRLSSREVEFYLKSKNRRWNNYNLPADNCFMIPVEKLGMVQLFKPDVPLSLQNERLCSVPIREVLVGSTPPRPSFGEIVDMARRFFHVLETAWRREGGTLVDLTLEFGYDTHGSIVLADPIDNTAWTVTMNGEYVNEPADCSHEITLAASQQRLITVASVTHRFSASKKARHHVGRTVGVA